MFCASRRRALKPFASPVAGRALLRTHLAAAIETILNAAAMAIVLCVNNAPLKVGRTEDGSIYAAISLR
jgi:hypothetical protein